MARNRRKAAMKAAIPNHTHDPLGLYGQGIYFFCNFGYYLANKKCEDT